MKIGDIVVSQCEVPKGANTKVKGCVGVIREIEVYENETIFRVKDERGDEWSYWEEELKYADVKEISEALIRMIERR